MVMALMVLGMILFWVLLILLSFGIAKALFNSDIVQPSSQSRQQKPKEILKERFLRGEINEDEYIRMGNDLE